MFQNRKSSLLLLTIGICLLLSYISCPSSAQTIGLPPALTGGPIPSLTNTPPFPTPTGATGAPFPGSPTGPASGGGILPSPPSPNPTNTAPSTIAFSASSYTSPAFAESVVVTVLRMGGSAGVASMNFTTIDGSAISGIDYGGGSGIIVWNDGDDTDKTITMQLNPDEYGDSAKTFSVKLFSPQNAYLGYPDTTTIFLQPTNRSEPQSSSSSSSSTGTSEQPSSSTGSELAAVSSSSALAASSQGGSSSNDNSVKLGLGLGLGLGIPAVAIVIASIAYYIRHKQSGMPVNANAPGIVPQPRRV